MRQSFFDLPESEHGCKMPSHHSILLADRNMRTALEIANEQHIKAYQIALLRELERGNLVVAK